MKGVRSSQVYHHKSEPRDGDPLPRFEVEVKGFEFSVFTHPRTGVQCVQRSPDATKTMHSRAVLSAPDAEGAKALFCELFGVRAVEPKRWKVRQLGEDKAA
ncbi:MAG TPA: hypothetical protein DEA08_19665 [Planctomycetes bacterium]|nr:hypothetical protein [Planctomycetota bacterium]|tara:strand:+ start:1112 stop:1414 length:303 start_codon:yes stop_codon:yes gene_type:complete